MVAPVSSARVAIWAISSALPATTPASASEWPFRYLVAEWATRSAPCSSGRQPSGVATVLSTSMAAPALLGQRGQRRQVGHVDLGIGDRLDVQEAGAVQRAGDGVQVGDVAEGRIAAAAQQRVGLAVQLPGRDHAGAGGSQQVECGNDRRHPRGKAVGGLGALQLGHRCGQLVAVGVADAAVQVAAAASRPSPR